MTLEELRQHLVNIYTEAMKQQHDAVKDVKSAEVKIVNDYVVVDLLSEDHTSTWRFRLIDGLPYDEDNDYVDFSSIDAFFCFTDPSCLIDLTSEETAVLDNYIFRKLCKLKDSGLEDSKCYIVLSSIRSKLRCSTTPIIFGSPNFRS